MAAKPNFGILNKGGQMELNDNYTVVAELKTRIRKFVTDRDWDQYHYPKDLAIGLAVEAAELLEHFRFRSNDELEELATAVWALTNRSRMSSGPFFGVQGNVVVGHGASRYDEVAAAITTANRCIEVDLLDSIKLELIGFQQEREVN